MAAQTIHGMVTPGDSALALIDFQPAMFAEVHRPLFILAGSLAGVSNFYNALIHKMILMIWQ